VHSDNIKLDGQAVRFGNLTLFCAEPTHTEFESFPWQHSNGKLESTQGARLTVKGDVGEFITVLCPGETLGLSTIPGGVKVGDDEITFAGNRPTAGDAATYVTVKRGGKEILTLKGQDINLERFQGEVGLFVPDAGYPFGEMPDWLLRQRVKPPAWYQELYNLAHPEEAK
jgi:hypothetical protein